MSNYKIAILNKKYNIEVSYKDMIGIEKCVYKLTFPDNSIYIGKAGQNLWERIQNHTTHFVNSKTRKDKAIEKFRKFKVDILKICHSDEELNFYEKMYIYNYASKIYEYISGNKDYDKYCREIVKPYILNETCY